MSESKVTKEMINAALPWLTNFQHMRATDKRNAVESAIAAALATQPQAPQGAVTGWQPIETAPRDGTHVLLGRFPEVGNSVTHVGVCAVDWWRQHKDAAGFTGWGKFNAQYWPPTHWQPIPAAPKTETPEVSK